MLEIRDISVNYGERRVLSNVSLNLVEGEILALIGPNGAGKSTLVRALAGLIPVQHGSITINGKDAAHLAPAQRARQFAFVPQAAVMPPAFTAWETVLLGRTPYINWLGQASSDDEDIARQAMQRTQTTELAPRRVGELSGGEQQRLLLARAIAQRTPILVLDEPTSHLDLQFQINLLDLVKSLARQERLAVILVLHDLNLVARVADHVALLVGGQIRAAGTPVQVLTPELLTGAYQVPLQVLPLGPNGGPIITPLIR